MTRFEGLNGKCWREGAVSLCGERAGHMAWEEVGILERRRAGPWVWEGCTFAPVPIFLGGSQSCHNAKEPFTFTFVLGCSLWYFRDIGPHAGTLFWKYELSYLPGSYISILCHIPLYTLEPVGFPKAYFMGIPQSLLEYGSLIFVG